ncbi:MAG: tetratricopeptide repeat protein [Candidatus Heimdallarchaeaceae archaeon]
MSEATRDLQKTIDLLVKQKKLQEAQKLMESHLEAFEDNSDFFLQLGKICFNLKEYDKAVWYLTRAIELTPENPEILRSIGDVYSAIKEWKQAIIAYTRVIEMGNFNPRVLFNLAKAFFESGKYYESKEILEQYLVDEPSVEGYLFLADIYRRIGNDIERWNALVRAEKLDSTNSLILIELGDYFFDLNDYKNAQKYYEKAVASDPTSIRGWFMLGKALKLQSKFQEAITAFLKVIEQDFDHAAAYYELGQLAASMANIDQAMEYYEKCLDKDPSFLEATIALASLYWVSKNYDQAFRYLEEGLKYSKDSSQIHQMLGDIYEELGQEELAKYHWNLAENPKGD